MAHFAELKQETDKFDSSKQNWVVQRVVVVGNDISTAAGPLGENDMHVDGETWCVNFFKGGVLVLILCQKFLTFSLIILPISGSLLLLTTFIVLPPTRATM